MSEVYPKPFTDADAIKKMSTCQSIEQIKGSPLSTVHLKTEWKFPFLCAKLSEYGTLLCGYSKRSICMMN